MKVTKEMLNEDQTAALEYIHRFLEDDRKDMVLTGPAGTGKTALLNVLLDEIGDIQGYEVTCTAPTNKAVDVIATSTGRDYSATIYGILGLVLIEDDDKPPRVSSIGTSKFKNYDLIIIDEASMVSTTLLGEIDKAMIESTHTKVIYVGDRCQIPPVSDANLGLFESPVFNLESIVSLTKVMRTSAQNPILGAVTAMRGNMQSPYDLFTRADAVGEDGGIWFTSDAKPFMAQMISYFTRPEYSQDSNYALAVAYTNKAVNYLNTTIRKAIYPDATMDYVVGEELRVTHPYKVSVNHREIFFFFNEERIIITECEECNDPRYGLPCYRVKAKACTKRKNSSSIDPGRMYIVKPSAMDTYYKLKSSYAEQAKMKLNETGHGNSKKYSKKEAWQDYNELKDFFLFVGYIYGLTAHKAQGTTVQNVFAIERNINRIPSDELRNKLKYTAFTRAAKELHVLY